MDYHCGSTFFFFFQKSTRHRITKPKDFRPISLLSSLLKPQERIIDVHIRESIDKSLISTSQHSYTNGGFIEIKLHLLVGYIERSIEYDKLTHVALVSVQDAFNNVKPSSIIQALTELGLDLSSSKFISKLLTKRIIKSNIDTTTLCKGVNMGTPQEDVLSLLLWNIASTSF